MADFVKRKLQFEPRFDRKTYRHTINGITAVLHCHHFATLTAPGNCRTGILWEPYFSTRGRINAEIRIKGNECGYPYGEFIVTRRK
ncbi:hypothetical protein [Treponema primitia]|uniref:hypothetical protein n=1 Tax=Treponema primitia TaxID=88058 RepID=UPI00025554EB|nr:hypothetical protein [Treponema primitia]